MVFELKVKRLFFFQAEDGIRDTSVTGVDVCSSDLPLSTSFVCLEVVDSGSGMSQTVKDRIFDPF